MKTSLFLAIAGLCLLSCQKEMGPDPAATEKIQIEKSAAQSTGKTNGNIQISGVGFYPEAGECDPADLEATYAVKMTGDLEGCLFIYVEDYNCSPSGTYRESGKEYFVGTLNGAAGTFWTKYRFESKFEACSPDGSALGSEIFGRCQHPLVPGSGTGVFLNATGRLDMKDDIEAGNFLYRGHLMF